MLTPVPQSISIKKVPPAFAEGAERDASARSREQDIFFDQPSHENDELIA